MSEEEIKNEEVSTEETETTTNETTFGNRMIMGAFELGNTLIVALIILILLMTFVFRHVTVDGSSMEDTLFNGDHLITTEIFYTPKCGDIVIVSHGASYNKPIVKRVIATAGQTLSIDYETNEVIVDGILLDETYVKGITTAVNRSPMKIPSVIPEGYVFVMGDNRQHSLDSRSSIIGLIPVEDIMGKAVLRFYPFNTFGFLS